MRLDRIAFWNLFLLFFFFFFKQQIALADTSVEEARVAFANGVQAVQQGDFEGAARAFEATFALQPTPNVEYNLAAALFELGHHAKAQQHLEHILAQDSVAGGVLVNARQLEARLRPQVAHLTVRVSLDGSQGARLYVDEAELPREEWGTSRPVDPGTHYLRVTDDSGVVNEREVAVAPGVDASVDLHLRTVIVQSPPPPSANLSVRANTREDAKPRRWHSWKVWVGVSAAVVVCAAAVGAGLAMRGRSDDTPQGSDGSLAPGVLRW